MMQKGFLRIVLTVIILASFGIFAGCENKEILKRMETYSKSLKSFRADITVDKFNSQLGEHDVTKGKLIYVPQKEGDISVRIDFTAPVQESLAVISKQYVLYRPRLSQAIIGKIDNPQISETVNETMAFMFVSKEQLQAIYNTKYLGEEKLSNEVLTHHLEFTPKAVKIYKTAEFWADNNGTPIQMKVVLDNNDSTTVLFTNIEKNIAINANVFKIKLPKNTKIIKP